jgi:hypothetical protein
MGVAGAIAKGSGAICGEPGAAVSPTGGAADEPLGESDMSEGQFTTKEQNACSGACARHARYLSTTRPSNMSKPTNKTPEDAWKPPYRPRNCWKPQTINTDI